MSSTTIKLRAVARLVRVMTAGERTFMSGVSYHIPVVCCISMSQKETLGVAAHAALEAKVAANSTAILEMIFFFSALAMLLVGKGDLGKVGKIDVDGRNFFRDV